MSRVDVRWIERTAEEAASENVHTGAFWAEPLFPEESESDDYFNEDLHTYGQEESGNVDSPLFLETSSAGLRDTDSQENIDNLPLSKGGASKKFSEHKGDVLTATVVLDSSTDPRITSHAGTKTAGLDLQARNSVGMEHDQRPDHSTDLDESFGIRLPVLDSQDNSIFAGSRAVAGVRKYRMGPVG
ncbi:hypothetical protein MRX96_034606 [Rhipicephalus microplus]